MTISIPAIVDAQLLALKNSIKPDYHSDTTTFSSPRVPYVNVNRAADVLKMLADLIGVTGLHVTGIHGAADTTNVVATADATDLTSAEALADALKAAYNAHRILTAGGVHGAADSTNVVTAAAATDEATTVALANDIRTQLIAHQAFITASTHGVADPAVVTLAACTNTATAIALLNQEKAIYNAHLANINGLSTTAVADLGAFTTANSLVGATVTFEGNITAALAGATAVVVTNTTGVLNFGSALPAAPKTGDHYSVSFSAIDSDLAVLRQGKGMGDSGSNPHAAGPNLINAIMKLIVQLGGSLPAYLDAAAATPFHIGSPSAGAGSYGHGGAILVADALQRARDAVAAYTKPA